MSLLANSTQQVNSGIVPLSSVAKYDKYVSRRETVQLTPREPLNYTGGKTISIDIPGGDHLIDGHNQMLEFKVKASTNGEFTLSGSGHDFIQRVVLKTRSGVVLTDMDDYNLVYTQLAQPSIGTAYCTKEWHSATDNLVNPNTQKLVINSAQELVFGIHLDLDLFKHQRFLHSPVLGQLVLEITWANISQIACNKAGTGSPGYEVVDCVYHLGMIYVDQEYVQSLQKQAQAGKLIYNPLVSRVVKKQHNGSTRQQLDISGGEQSVEKCFIVRQVIDELTSVDVVVDVNGDEGKFYTAKSCRPSTAAAQTQEQWRHGSELYPKQAITDPEQAYFYLEKAMETLGDTTLGSLLTRQNYKEYATGSDTVGASAFGHPRYLVGYDFTRAGRNTGISLEVNSLQFQDSVSANPLADSSQLAAILMYSAIIQVVDPSNVFVGN
jgi:hypothetical protein